jgi:hypothetical protein
MDPKTCWQQNLLLNQHIGVIQKTSEVLTGKQFLLQRVSLALALKKHKAAG